MNASNRQTLKNAFIEALNDTPLAPYLETCVKPGSIEIPPDVTDALTAQKACGIFARNMSEYLKAWEGIPLLYVALYTGNNVQALQGLLLTSVRARSSNDPSDFEPLSPSEGAAFGNDSEIEFALQIINGHVTNCLVSLDNKTPTPMRYDDNGVWKRTLKVSGVGDHTAGFYVIFDGGYMKEKTVSFVIDNR